MTLANKTDRQPAREADKPQSRGFILTLICMAIFILLAHALFPPVASSARTDGWVIGP
jgi:hypothetical protein